MKSFTSALLGAAALSQAVSALSVHHNHGHGHVHARRGNEYTPYLNPDDGAYLQSKGIKTGTNSQCSKTSAIGVGQDGDFIVELNNKSPHSLIVVAWSGADRWGAVTAGFVGAHTPDITTSLRSNDTAHFSYSPANGKDSKSISGGIAPIYPGGGLTPFSGQIDDTWVEFTFTSENEFSATDVSRIINMNGNKVEVHNYANQAAKDAGTPACSSTMDACSFVCADGSPHCMVGALVGCPAGKVGTLGNAEGTDGGCGGMSSKGGYVQVNFY